MTDLENEVRDLRARVEALAERVRLDAVADEFLRGIPKFREGDYFLYGTFPTQLMKISSEGKWTYFNGTHVIQPFRIPEPEDHERLYTAAEVAEILAKAKGESPR